MGKAADEWKKAACIQMMFQPDKVKESSKRYFFYSTIAKVLGMPYSKVYHICSTAHTKKNKQKVSRTNKSLT